MDAAPQTSGMIYLDNNATTVMPTEVQREFLAYCNMGNPSASYATANESRAMMTKFRRYIGKLCGVDTCCVENRDAGGGGGESASAVQVLEKSRKDPSKYKVVFVSGASEANCTMLKGVVDAYTDVRKVIPNVVMGATEHRSLLDMARSLEERGRITLSIINPTASGHILPEAVAAAIRADTCLVCVMHANNETGAINDVAEIGRIAHTRNVPFHCDTVQTFGKFPINPVKCNIDSFCVSFHKFGGPPGIGVLVIKQQLLNGYDMQPLIFGSQNEGLRGGTENLPGIGASFAATTIAMKDRDKKNARVLKLKRMLMAGIAERVPTRRYPEYIEVASGRAAVKSLPQCEVVFLSGIDSGGVSSQDYLHNTILLSVVKRPMGGRGGKFVPMCNSEMKKQFEKQGIVVSVGSACNTASPKASHVLYSMGADEYIRKGALRISLGDNNTEEEVRRFIDTFIEIVAAQVKK
jgi:cysteine desulfurase